MEDAAGQGPEGPDAPPERPDQAPAAPVGGGGAPRWAVIGIFLILCVHAFAYARSFLMPVVLAVLLALVFSPPRRFFERLGLGSGLSALLIVGALVATLLGGVATLSAPAARWVEDAPRIGFMLRMRLEELRGVTEGVREAAEQVDEIASGGAAADEGADRESDVQRVVVEEPGYLFTAATNAPAVLAQILFTLVLLFFLLASGDLFYAKIVQAMPTLRDKRRALRIARDVERKLSRYLFTITLINAGLGVAIGLAMWALGMPNPLLFAALGFFLNYIPYVGALLGVAIALGVGMIALDDAGSALVAAGVYLGLTSIEGQLVTPWFVGRNLKLNTVVVFVSVTLWAWLWSVVGMLVATPLLVVIKTLCEHIPALQPLGRFLSGRDEDPAGRRTD